MKALAWIKHGITLITLGSLLIGLVQLMGLDVESESFGNNILSSTFFLFLFAVLAVYRISWIGRNKMDWIATSLALLSLVSLIIMLLAPKNVMAFWKPSLAIFILLVGYSFYLKLERKNWSGIISKILLIFTCLCFLYPLLIKTGSGIYYSTCWYLLGATFVFACLNAILPEKQR